MKISLSTPTFDPAGLLLIDYSLKSSKDLKRRVSRTATMDGSCVFDDLGFSWSDIDLDLKLTDLSKAQEEQLSYLVKNYGVLNVVINEGAFSVLVESYSFKDGEGALKLLILGER